MKKTVTTFFIGIITLALIIFGGYIVLHSDAGEPIPTEPEKSQSKIARADYFINMLKDPETGRIPPNIRSRELSFARTLPGAGQVRQQLKTKDPTFQAADYVWSFAGPIDIGGRTRALGIDQRDPNIILAGGVSGGMWRSTDGGTTWNLQTPDFESFSVSSLAQDPNNPDTWYYSSGEFLGNTAGDPGAPYFGTGIYKSTDNGITWNRLSSTSDTDASFNTQFDFISRVVVSPSTSSVFFSSNGFGVYRSDDGGTSFSSDPVIGTAANQIYADVAVASDGKVAAVISQRSFDQGSQPNNPGVFLSTSDGADGSWTEITPSTFPSNHGRSIVKFAPSNPEILYVITFVSSSQTTGESVPNEDVRLHRIDLAAGTSQDLSSNIPDFGACESGSGAFWTQSGYDIDVTVKPDDENFVMIGGTNLFRGRNGFTSSPSGGYDCTDENQKDEYWIGGYNQNGTFALYPNQHPDQHVMAFPDPINNPNRVIAGHDGGLSITTDITASPVSWSDLDEGYTTSQYYSAAIPSGSDDERLVGGMQDNGSPFFRFNGNQSQSTSNDISFGDGGYSYFSPSYIFVSQQRGRVIRYSTDLNGDPIGSSFAFVHPSGATGQLFIHPYVIDPNDETIMYYPSTDENGTPNDGSDDQSFLYRNTQINLITNQNGDGTSSGWESLRSIDMPTGYSITALEVSNQPANVLYYAGSKFDGIGASTNEPPILKRLTNANSAQDGEADVSPGGTASGAYVKDIAINPVNADEVLVVMSNYNITGLYHTTDGGQNWTAVEGNLTGTNSNPGPSLRSATIIPAESGLVYVLGTSTGIYSTQNLDGSNTTWGQEAISEVGFSVTEYLASRVSDGDIAAGTHGRGMFKGTFQGTTNVPFITLSPTEARTGDEITLQANNFTFNSNPSQNEVTIGREPAEVVSATTSTLRVIVPRDPVNPDAPTTDAVVSVTTDGQTVTAILNVLPPQSFAVQQNFPNPFSPSTQTHISFDLPQDSRVTISIYDMAGREVLVPILNQSFNGGTYNTPIDVGNVASGVYIYRVVAKSERGSGTTHSAAKKMTFIK